MRGKRVKSWHINLYSLLPYTLMWNCFAHAHIIIFVCCGFTNLYFIEYHNMPHSTLLETHYCIITRFIHLLSIQDNQVSILLRILNDKWFSGFVRTKFVWNTTNIKNYLIYRCIYISWCTLQPNQMSFSRIWLYATLRLLLHNLRPSLKIYVFFCNNKPNKTVFKIPLNLIKVSCLYLQSVCSIFTES